MNTYIIDVPFGGDEKDWIHFANQCKSDISEFESVTIDFNKVGFLAPDELVIVSCLIETFHSIGAEIHFRNGTRELKNHLENIKFNDYWKNRMNRRLFNASDHSSTLGLWHIEKEQIESYSEYSKNYYKRFLGQDLDYYPLTACIKECLNNLFDHSCSEISGFILSQYFSSSGKLVIAVCDFGIGIGGTVNNYNIKNNLPRISDDDAIKKSLQSGFTSKSVINNLGFGLSNIERIVKESNGELYILSNGGLYSYIHSKPVLLKQIEVKLSGTLIKIVLDTTTFLPLETDEDIFDF